MLLIVYIRNFSHRFTAGCNQGPKTPGLKWGSGSNVDWCAQTFGGATNTLLIESSKRVFRPCELRFVTKHHVETQLALLVSYGGWIVPNQCWDESQDWLRAFSC